MQGLHRSMWHYAGTSSAGSQSVWMVDSTCTLQLQACPLAHIQAANIHSPDSLGVRTLDCWELVLWMYFSMICERQSCTECRSTNVNMSQYIEFTEKTTTKDRWEIANSSPHMEATSPEVLLEFSLAQVTSKTVGFCLSIDISSINKVQSRSSGFSRWELSCHPSLYTIKRTDLSLNMEFIFALGLFCYVNLM